MFKFIKSKSNLNLLTLRNETDNIVIIVHTTVYGKEQHCTAAVYVLSQNTESCKN